MMYAILGKNGIGKKHGQRSGSHQCYAARRFACQKRTRRAVIICVIHEFLLCRPDLMIEVKSRKWSNSLALAYQVPGTLVMARGHGQPNAEENFHRFYDFDQGAIAL
jgi:hypothetical protein